MVIKERGDELVSPTINLQYIKKNRLEMGLSIEEMSKKLGYDSYQAYYRKENGQRKFNTYDLLKLSDIFQEPVEKFLK